MNNTAKSASQFALFLILFSTFASFSISALLLGLGADIEKAQLVLIIIQDIIIILIPVLIYCLVSRKKLTDIVPHNKLTLKNIGYITALTICFAPVMSLISALTTIFYPADVNSDVLTYIDKLSMPLVVLALGIMPAVFEELAFRGIILPQSRRAGFIASSLLSGLFFGLFHQDFYQIGYAIVAGVFFSFLVANTNSIYSSMFSHFLINGSQVIYTKLLLGIIDENTFNEIMSQTQQTGADLYTIVSALLFAVILLPFLIITGRKFIKYNTLNRAEYELSPNKEGILADTSAQKSGVINIYSILYVAVCILLTLLYSAA